MSTYTAPVAKKARTGGFEASREFGFDLENLFPRMDFAGVDTEGVALVVEITDRKRLNVFKLSKVLIGAAHGGLKTAVISVKDTDMQTAIPLFDLFMQVDKSTRLKEMTRLEKAISTGV
ncbi:hypothetical protein [Streptomyces sp. NPDC057363]|uniref:hypothetical protein n=1 Tax=Streptomyces sp. NPDC057363 TaxID=3346107 RepID=UPI0036259FF7